MSDTSSDIAHSGDTTATTATTTDVNAAGASTVEDQGVKSIHDVVNETLAKTETPPGSGELGKDVSSTTSVEEKPEAKAGELDDAELKQYSARVQTRIRELHAASKEAEATVATVKQEVEQLKPRAEYYDRLQTYMDQHQITPDHFQNALSITAMINAGDHEAALQTVMPIVQQLLELTGRVLPPELQEKVETGYVTPDIAMQLQRERAKAANLEERSRASAERQEAERQHAENVQMAQLYGSVPTEWENAKKTSDPDWSIKGPLVSTIAERELLRRRHAAPETLPRDAKGIRQILDAALKEAEQSIAPFRPKPQAASVINGRAPTAGATSKPTSLMDAVNQALNAG